MHGRAKRCLRDKRSMESKLQLEAMKFKSGTAFPCTTLSGERKLHRPPQVQNFHFPLVSVGKLLAITIFSHIWGGVGSKVKKKKKNVYVLTQLRSQLLLTYLSGKAWARGLRTGKPPKPNKPFPSIGWILAAFIHLNPRIILSSHDVVTLWEP